MSWSRREDPWLHEERAWRPLASWWLLGVIGAVFVLQYIAWRYVEAGTVLLPGGGISFPGTFWPGPGGERVHNWHNFVFVIGTDWLWRPWTLVTSTLSHGGFSHILFNGMFLFFFGPNVERLLGRRRFVALFFVAGALSGIIQVHASSWLEFHTLMAPGVGALGASGALMMCMGILMVLTPRSQMFFMLIPVPVPMWLAGIGYAVLDVLGTFNPSSPIGNFAHLSGMALGLGYGVWAKQDLKRRGLRIVQD